MPVNLIRERAGKPTLLQPYLHALDRMQKREFPAAEDLAERARSLLHERFGPSPDPVEATFANASTGLLGEHTHYFDGFALLLVLPLGTAVAVRRSSGPHSNMVFEGSEAAWQFDGAATSEAASAPGWPVWARLVEQLSRRIAAGVQIEIAVTSTVNPAFTDAYLSSLSVAAARALQTLFSPASRPREVLGLARDLITASTGAPFSLAYLLAVEAGRVDAFALVDTATAERILLDAPDRDVLGWGIVEAGTGPQRDAEFYRKRQAMADEAARLLQKAFPGLTSLRDLEHRDLQHALEVLPRRLRPVLRHLVTENRRVQKMVVAIRQRDWQMFGALLLMSHASHRNDWESTSPEMDVAVEQVERMSIDGMYGAAMTGRSGCVLVTGQPYIVPRCLDRIAAALEERFGLSPDVTLL